jgi:ABC-type multidrug transport system permease subunit
MLRTVILIFRNEFRRFARDRAALFMLFLAPVVIIAVAGFSLGNMYGARPSARVYLIPVVDRDHGAIAKAITDALAHQRSIKIARAADLDEARRIVLGRGRAPLAIVIPAGTTAAFEAGRTAPVLVYADPIRRVEASAIEIRLDRLSQHIAAAARDRAQTDFSQKMADLRSRLDRLAAQAGTIQSDLADYRRNFAHARSAIQASVENRIRSRIRRRIEALEAQTQAAIERSIATTRAQLAGQLSAKRDAIAAVDRYLRELQSSEHAFDRWLAKLKAAAGSHAADIPAPPAWPAPPSREQLADLVKPLELFIAKPALPKASAREDFAIEIPGLKLPAVPGLSLNVRDLIPAHAPVLPGDIGWRDESLVPGSVEVNTFDQYVPGFGITFLLIDMLWGLSIGLIDERDWGTLERLRVSGAPIPGMLVGKLMARFLIGFVQMVVLFAVGWLLFGISLGRSAPMLLLPAAAISFAAAAFGLVIACIARTRDSVLPIGSVAAMAMSAIGGCWWPLDFEPAWMRSLAQWVPTTWTMQAFNDLMIRGLEPSSAIWPAAVTFALGLVFLVAGILGSSQFYE